MSQKKEDPMTVALMVAVTVVCLIIAYNSSSCKERHVAETSTVTTAPDAGSNSDIVVDLGGEGVLTMPEGGDVFLGVDKEADGEVMEASIAKDEARFLDLLASGRVFKVEMGTRAKKIDSTWTGVIQVRILSGKHEGKSGWTAMEYLRKTLP